MRILFLSPRQCWPPRSGAKLREYHFARALGESAELSLVYFADPGSPSPSVADLPFCKDLVAVSKPRPYTAGKILRGLAGRWPLPVVNYNSVEMSAAVSRLAETRNYDLIHLDSIHMAVYAAPLRQVVRGPARFVLNWHNIESELLYRYARQCATGARKLYSTYTAFRMASLERDLLLSSLGHIVCSPRERSELLAISPAARIAVVENGVDTSYFQPSENGSRRSLVFVGLMDYHANVEAAVRFAGTVWPSLARRFPDLEFKIVGANPAPDVLALRAGPRITVTGTVDDVRPFYEDALAAVVPLRTGGGTRLKILEAMAAGVPVISTLVGAEGLAAEPERHLLIAADNDPADWERQIARILTSPAQSRSLSAAALDLVRSQYDWAILGQRLAATYHDWLQDTR